MRHRPIIPITAAFVAGIFAAECISAEAWAWLWAAVAALSVSGLLWRLLPGKRVVSAALLVAVAAAGGAWHMHRLEGVGTIRDFCASHGTIARVRGTVLRAPVSKPGRHFTRLSRASSDARRQGCSQFVMRATAIQCGTQWARVSGRLKCKVGDPGLSLHEGDCVETLGKLARIRPPTCPGQFDRLRYAQRKGIAASLFSPVRENVEVIGRASGPRLRHWPAWLRGRVRKSLSESLDPDAFAVSMSMLLGCRECLPQRLSDAFKHTGTVHFLAISGLHVGIMAGFLWLILLAFRTRQETRSCVILAFLLGYGALVGWRPSVTRAVTMMAALFCAPLLRRVWDRASAISMAVLVILLLNPADLFNVGFHLSLAGVLGILLLSPRFTAALFPDAAIVDRLQAPEERPLWWSALPRGLARLFCVSLGAWVATLPLVARSFHLFTPLVVIFNLAAGLLVWLLLSAGMLVVLTAGMLAPVAAPFIQWSSHVLLAVVAHGERIPGCYFHVVGPSVAWVCVYYLLVCLWLGRRRLLVRRRPILILTLLVANAYVFAHGRPVRHRALRATFLDVGHGLSVFVELPGGRTLLYDVGSGGYPAMGATKVAPFLWASNLERIDAVVLSHSDSDHYNGLPALADRVKIGSIVTSESFMRSAVGKGLEALARKHKIRLVCAGSGDRLCLSESADIKVLHPPRQCPILRRLSTNDRSLVLRIESNGRSVLLTGDAKTAAWVMIRASGDHTKSDVVSAPHHGSFFEGYRHFVADHARAIAVVSNRRGDMSQDAEAEWARAGIQLFQTALLGATRVTLAPERLLVDVWRGGRWKSVAQRRTHQSPAPIH